MKFIRFFILSLAIALMSLFFPFLFLFRPFDYRNTSAFLKILKKVFVPFIGLEYEVQNKQQMLDSLPAILVGNHQSNWDLIMASIAFDERIVFFGKSQIALIPFFGQMYMLGGNISVDRSNKTKAKKSLKKVERIIKSKDIGVVIFPEGHRSRSDKLLPFKNGAFRSAIAAGVPIIPFAVNFFSNDIDLSKKKSGKVVIRYFDPIPTIGLTNADISGLSQRVRKIIQAGMDELNRNSPGSSK